MKPSSPRENDHDEERNEKGCKVVCDTFRRVTHALWELQNKTGNKKQLKKNAPNLRKKRNIQVNPIQSVLGRYEQTVKIISGTCESSKRKVSLKKFQVEIKGHSTEYRRT